MSITTDTYHQAAIMSAKARLEGARAQFEHCPSGENDMRVTAAARLMDEALDRWASQRPQHR
jgi:uncharacterized protein (DUF2384 family)